MSNISYRAGQSSDKPFMLSSIPVVPVAPAQARWEYRVVAVDLREEAPLDATRLNELGTEGWLLAGMLEEQTRSGAAPRIHYYFVRTV